MPRPTLAHLAATLRPTRRTADVSDTDHSLLTKFVQSRDEAAFRTLVSRHAKTVLTACRQVLTDPADIDDSFQATFLVLLKKANAVDGSVPLGGWLFAVAHRVAVRCRSDKARRSAREAEAARRKPTTELPDLSWREAAAVLHAELNSLPDKYRLPLLLCGVQGLTRDEAAEQLGTTVGAIRGQLERGRTLLERRLAKRGVVLSAGLLAVLVGSSSAAGGPPAGLIDLAVGVVHGNASSSVAALAHGAFPMTTLWTRTLLTVMAVGLLGAGVGLTPQVPTANADEKKPAQDKMEKPKADAKGEAKKGDELTERTVTGKVVGPDGKPVQAELLLFWNRKWTDERGLSGGTTEAIGKTAADGTFNVTVQLKSPGCFLVAKADGFGFDFMMPATNTPAEVTFKLPKDVPIKARIVDGEGKPIAGATVRLETLRTFKDGSAQAFLDSLPKRTNFREHPVMPAEWVSIPNDSPFRATTDKDGWFEIKGVGGERLVGLEVKATGREDADVDVVTRAGLDVKPLNQATLALQPKTGEQLTWDFNPILSTPDFTLTLAAEQPVKGRVTDAATGKPRAGVRVAMESNNGVTRTGQQAITDADGRYVMRGAKKLPTYTVSVQADMEAGYLPAQATANDTVGHEAVAADIACQKGVIVTGTVRDKATGKPVPNTRLRAEVVTGNTNAAKYPSLGEFSTLRDVTGKPDGTFRMLVIPGPVLLMCGDGEFGIRTKYRPAKADPHYPSVFTKARDGGGFEFFTATGAQGIVDGNWCKVLNAKETDTEVKVDIELEAVAKKLVKVVDADGKPVKNARASGFTFRPWHYAEAVGDTDEIPVFDLTAKEKRLVVARLPEKKLVGSAEVSESDAAPVIKLGTGGTAKGRVVGADGKPVAGLTVKLYFSRREVSEIYGGLGDNRKAVTDAEGRFQFDELLPGYEFRFLFSRGLKKFGPEYQKAAVFGVGSHGEVKDLGDLKADTNTEREE